MKKAPSTWHSIRLALGCFLLLSFLGGAIHLPQPYKTSGNLLLTKKLKGSSQGGESEAPYEEAEKEIQSRIEEKSKDPVLLLSFFDFPSSRFAEDTQTFQFSNFNLSPGNSPGVPLYLSKRTLLI